MAPETLGRSVRDEHLIAVLEHAGHAFIPVVEGVPTLHCYGDIDSNLAFMSASRGFNAHFINGGIVDEGEWAQILVAGCKAC